MKWKNPIQKYTMSFLKWFFVFCIFCTGFIWSTEWWLTFIVSWTSTSFSVSSFCHPNSVNNYSITYDKTIIKIWNKEINTPECNSLLTKLSISWNIQQTIVNGQYTTYGSNRNIAYYNGEEIEQIWCSFAQLTPIRLNDRKIITEWNSEIRCNISFKNTWPHTITIDDPLYKESTPNSWQITNIKIWLTGTYIVNYDAESNYNSGNVSSINQMNWLPQLKILDLSNNKITSTRFLINNQGNKVANLEKIDLSNNKINSIEQYNLGSHEKLKELNLSSNNLTEINSDTFKNSSITNLEYFDLSKNKISNIEAKAFSKFSSGLKELRLNWQNTTSLKIAPYTFSWLNKLTSLHLENNKITKLEWHIFYWLNRINNLYLHNNQITWIISNYNWEDPFDNFATHSSWKILIDLSNNQIQSTKPNSETWRALPESLNWLLNKFNSDWTKLKLWSNDSNTYRNKSDSNYKLELDLSNNKINYIKIKPGSNNTEQSFQRFWYSYNHSSPIYKREIKNDQWEIKLSWNKTGINGNNDTYINIWESFNWTLHMYILSGSEEVAHDQIRVETENNSYITIKEWDNEIQDDYSFPFRAIKLKIEWHLWNISNVHYTYEIEKWSEIYLSGDFSNSNIFQNTFNFNENWKYTITAKMYNADDEEITKKTATFYISVPYDQCDFKITHPESRWLASTGTLDHISRFHDRKHSHIDYWDYISWFLYEIKDWDWISHLSWFKKINTKNSQIYPYRFSWYEINNLNLNLPNWRYTLTIIPIDIYETEIQSWKSLTFDKWNVFIIKFYSNWWSSIPQKIIGEWLAMTKPANPIKTWYIFKWRYTNNSLTNEYDFNTPITGSFSLFAKREKEDTPTEPIDPTVQYYTLTINYIYDNWTIIGTDTQNLTGGASYSITSPTISGYTPSQAIISWIMRNSNQTFNVTYTKDENPWSWNGNTTTTSNSSDLYLKVSNKNPDIDERVKLTINVNEKYTWKIYFPKMQYYNGSKRINIYNTSSSYISDSSDELDDGQVQFRSSDEWSIIISKFVKFSRSGKFRIYAEDKYWDDTYVQVNVADDDDNSSSSNSSNSSSDESNLTLSVNSASQTIYEPIDLTIKTDNYVWKINLYAKYKELTSNYWLTLNNTSTEYLSDYSNIWENWYYKMTSSDKGKKTFSKLVEFKKPWTYRLYAEDANWYANFVQIYVNENNNTTSISSSNTKTNTWSSSENDEIEKLLRELLNKKWNNSSLSSSPNTSSPSTSSQSIERNKQNISSSNDEVYISRSCKEYRIQYNTWLWVFTSPDIKKAEYFINKDYFKRYIDSKNKQVEGCPTNAWWISTNYKDTSSNNEYYIAPNGKVYFFTRENWTYKSSWLSKDKQFQSLSEIKYYIRDRNPLIWMTNVK